MSSTMASNFGERVVINSLSSTGVVLGFTVTTAKQFPWPLVVRLQTPSSLSSLVESSSATLEREGGGTLLLVWNKRSVRFR